MSYDAFDSFGLNEEQRAFRQKCHEFARDVIRPAAKRADKEQHTPLEFFSEAARAGIYTPELLFEAYLDPTGRSIAIAAEELCWGDGGLGLALLYPALPMTALMLAGTGEQQARFIPELFGTADAPNLVSFAASEPGAGSDVGSISTTAVRDGDHWVLNGVKRWAGNTSRSTWYFVMAQVDCSLGSRGQALFAVPASAEGVTYGPKMSKLGLRAITHADLHLNNVRIPLDDVIGGPDRLERRLEKARSGEHRVGQAAMQTFEATRPFVAAMAVGVARAAHETAFEYSLGRVAFDRPIIEHQQVAASLARQRTKIDAARLMVHRASAMQAARDPMAAAEGSQAKLFAADMVREVTIDALQVAGGLGFTDALLLERAYRDAPIYGIFEGTSEIQALVIASTLAGRRIR
jgi:acyl-CoA dehydrogenase